MYKTQAVRNGLLYIPYIFTRVRRGMKRLDEEQHYTFLSVYFNSVKKKIVSGLISRL